MCLINESEKFECLKHKKQIRIKYNFVCCLSDPSCIFFFFSNKFLTHITSPIILNYALLIVVLDYLYPECEIVDYSATVHGFITKSTSSAYVSCFQEPAACVCVNTFKKTHLFSFFVCIFFFNQRLKFCLASRPQVFIDAP